VLFYAAATWGNAGFLREQVCRSLCPFARMQPLLIDPYTTHAVRRAPRRTARHAPSGHGGVLGRGRGLRPDHRGLRVPRRASAAGRTDAHLQRPPGDWRVDLRRLCQRLPDARSRSARDRRPITLPACGARLDACSQQQHRAGFGSGLVRYCSPQAMPGNRRQLVATADPGLLSCCWRCLPVAPGAAF
jgi:hypothetical protein